MIGDQNKKQGFIRDVQLDWKVLWDGHLARPDWAGKMPTPQLVRDFGCKVVHRVSTL